MKKDNNQDKDKIINASVSKTLFVDMLTKDIPLMRAILDLVDNSVDGARHLRKNGKFNNLRVDLTIDQNKFKIVDNCGGIPVKIAREYAFRFGRADDAPDTPGSVGQFGVGMKRAFFKLGKRFIVDSKTKNNSFLLDVDVVKWEKQKEWIFEFDTFSEDTKNSDDDIGTVITVSPLHDNVASVVSQDNFQTKLSQELATAHLLSINKGLQISLNGIPIQMRELNFNTSKFIKPAKKEIKYEGKKRGESVKVTISVGIADTSLQDAGWYVFCNGRMLLEREKTQITGWGEKDSGKIPQYHAQFAAFRGYVFFNSDEAELLPWNTTKTGVDTDSPIYQSVRLEMINMMRPVIDFLNELKESKDNAGKDSALDKIVSSAKPTNFEDITSFSTTFETPKYKKVQKVDDSIKINYSVPKEQAEAVKKTLKANSWRVVGEKTFEYYFKLEVED